MRGVYCLGNLGQWTLKTLIEGVRSVRCRVSRAETLVLQIVFKHWLIDCMNIALELRKNILPMLPKFEKIMT